ncbi:MULTISPECIES: hypothetical protein [unclassified Pseudomonas]|uniref:hypothetical protein n=1 Tax=unclassified Pseudomonas TaxID=196821 RepID=UPI0021BAE3F5|nr:MULTISPECIES: hypothetical protein [unclassified Pseudomonas]MCT8165545.1 hypothetical protein [Pseudomonas sp. HD6422]MCT8184631.1 hypothetical protein [Pseudomonas sp. HD6421]
MKPLSLFVISAQLLVAGAAWADENRGTWSQEPTTFLGVDLQGDFVQQVAECPTDGSKPEGLCRVATANPDSYEVRGLPYLPISPGYKLVANLKDGQVNELVFSGNANSLYLVTDMLTQRFGEPSDQHMQWIKMKSGASYQTEVMSWRGENVAVNFQRMESDLGKYAVTLTNVMPVGTTPAVDAISSAEASDVIEAPSSKL